MWYSIKEIENVIKTARVSGSVGPNAIVPRVVREFANKHTSILDYGSGRKAIHAHQLADEGFNVKAYDLSGVENHILYVNINKLDHLFDMVYASNVLNVQPNLECVYKTLQQISKIISSKGLFIVNYPVSPRKSNLTVSDIEFLLSCFFSVVNRIRKVKKEGKYINCNSVIWKCYI